MKKFPKSFLIYVLLLLSALLVSQPAYCSKDKLGMEQDEITVVARHLNSNQEEEIRRELDEEDGLLVYDFLNEEERSEEDGLPPHDSGLNVSKRVSKINQEIMHFGIEHTSAGHIYRPKDDSFPKNMDNAFFRSSSKKVKFIEWLSTLYGLGVPVAMSEIVLGGVPVGGVVDSVPGLSGVIEAVIVVTTLPVAARVGYERAGEIATSLFGERKYTALGKDDEVLDSRPHTFTKSFPHKAAFLLGTVGAGLNALIPTMLMISEEVPYFDVFAGISAPFIWIFYADASYTLEQRYIRNFFNSYFYHTPIRAVEERALQEGIEKFLKFVNSPNEDSAPLINAVYDTFMRVLEQRQKLAKEQNVNGKKSFEANEIMLFSLLMITQTMREDDERWSSVNSTNEELDIQEIELESDGTMALRRELKQLKKAFQSLREKNKELAENVEKSAFFKKDVDAVKPAWKEAFMETVSQLMIGAAFCGRVEILKTTIDQLLQAVGVDPTIAGYIGYGLATPEVLFRTLVETNAHKEQFKGWLGAFSFRKSTNLSILRKFASVTAALDGLIYALPGVLVGLDAFKDYSTLAKFALITPCALLDFSVFSRLFSQYNDAIITGVATIRKSDKQCIAGKRAHLNRWAEQAKRTLPKLHNETISELYKKLMGGI